MELQSYSTLNPSLSLSIALPKSYSALLRARTKYATENNGAILDWDQYATDQFADHWKFDAANTFNTSSKSQNACKDWETAAYSAFPDDFPVLLLNLTRFQQEIGKKESDECIEITVQHFKSVLGSTFAAIIEPLFEKHICFHAFHGTVQSMQKSFQQRFPTDTFVCIEYPSTVDGVPLHTYLLPLSRVSVWNSVEYIQEALRSCSRDIKWKAEIAIELEVLATSEYSAHEKRMRDLEAEIETLNEIRLELQKRDQDASLRLDQVELELKKVLDAYLEDSELTELDVKAVFGTEERGIVSLTRMSVLDMVISMIFSRLPHSHSSSKVHYQSLADQHVHILKLWKRDFGRLPPSRLSDSTNSEVISGAKFVIPEKPIPTDTSRKSPPHNPKPTSPFACIGGLDTLRSLKSKDALSY